MEIEIVFPTIVHLRILFSSGNLTVNLCFENKLLFKVFFKYTNYIYTAHVTFASSYTCNVGVEHFATKVVQIRYSSTNVLQD